MFRSFVGHFFKPSRLTLDNIVFRLHYRVTVGLLLVCAAALLWKINYGNPINCVSRSDDVSSFVLNDHCWYDGIFTNPSARNLTVGIDVPAPGLGKGKDKEYHNVHRWVVIAVLVQAAFFYLPRIIWRSFEGKLIQRLSWSMNEPKKASSVKMFRKELITNYLRSFSPKNSICAGGLLLCEVLNLINVFVQILLVSHILQITFPSVGLLVKSGFERTDASALSSFPQKTKCEFFTYGRSGDVVKHSAFCLMSVNGVMESIFIYQWIWFALLTVLSAMAVLYRLVLLIIPQFRVLRLSSQATVNDFTTLQYAVRRLGLGEWFVLYMLSKNIDPIDTRDILEGLTSESTTKDTEFSMGPL